MSLTEMPAPQYSATRRYENLRQQNLRLRVPPHGLDLNAYYPIQDQILAGTLEAGSMFIHGPLGTLFFYDEEEFGFGTAYPEAYQSFWTQQTTNPAAFLTPPSGQVDNPVQYATAGHRAGFFRAQAPQQI